MYSYLSYIMLLMAIAYALSILYSKMIPSAIVHSILLYVLPLWLGADAVEGQYLPRPLHALFVWIFFSNSNWNFNCNKD